jgi:hypothetical protein
MVVDVKFTICIFSVVNFYPTNVELFLHSKFAADWTSHRASPTIWLAQNHETIEQKYFSLRQFLAWPYFGQSILCEIIHL